MQGSRKLAYEGGRLHRKLPSIKNSLRWWERFHTPRLKRQNSRGVWRITNAYIAKRMATLLHHACSGQRGGRSTEGHFWSILFNSFCKFSLWSRFSIPRPTSSSMITGFCQLAENCLPPWRFTLSSMSPCSNPCFPVPCAHNLPPSCLCLWWSHSSHRQQNYGYSSSRQQLSVPCCIGGLWVPSSFIEDLDLIRDIKGSHAQLPGGCHWRRSNVGFCKWLCFFLPSETSFQKSYSLESKADWSHLELIRLPHLGSFIKSCQMLIRPGNTNPSSWSLLAKNLFSSVVPLCINLSCFPQDSTGSCASFQYPPEVSFQFCVQTCSNEQPLNHILDFLGLPALQHSANSVTVLLDA